MRLMTVLAVGLCVGLAVLGDRAAAQGTGPLDAARFDIFIASETLDRMQRAAARGRTDRLATLARDYERAFDRAMRRIDQAAREGRPVGEALAQVEAATQTHSDVLADLLARVPEEARPAIAHALEASRTGRSVALDRLQSLRRGEIPSGRPTTPDRPVFRGRGDRPDVQRPQRSGPTFGLPGPSGRGGLGGFPGGGPPGGGFGGGPPGGGRPGR